MNMYQALKKTVEEFGEPYTDATIRGDNRVVGGFQDPFDFEKPFDFVLMVDSDANCLLIVVPDIADAARNPHVQQWLLRLNNKILLGKVGIDRHGMVDFDVAVPIQTDSEGVWEPNSRLIERLLEVTASVVLNVRAETVFASMVTSGIDESVAREFVDKHMSKFGRTTKSEAA